MTDLVHSLLDAAAADSPGRYAVRDATGRWTYAELAERARAFTTWLIERGVRPGDRVVVQSPTRRELAAMFYGTVRAGAVFVPINKAMKAFHLASVVRDAEPAIALVTADLAVNMREVATAPVHDFDDAWAEVLQVARRPGQLPAPEVEPEDLAALIYTSGSTALPKAVMAPHAQITFASRAIQAEMGYRADDVVFCRFPLSWDYGLYKVLLCALGRSEIVLDDGESDLVLLRRMRETGTTVVPIVPSLATMITLLAKRSEGPMPPVRLITNTGAALPAATIEALKETFPGVRVVRQYGQTECKRITVMPPEREQDKPDSVGRPFAGTTVRVLGPDGAELPPGQVGEIVAEGPHVMPGYWRRPDLTATTFRRTGEGVLRLHTGDYGSLDADGYLYFEGRRDDMFKRRGIRMSTTEIEAAAMDIAGVRAAAAVPPGEGRDLTLFVESELAPKVVIKELSVRLEPAKVPAVCRVLETFPLTLHGKNARKALIDMLEGNDR
ncbi:AMP-dependent synthetase and ligase [Paractinoplanes abujensis]|uniref:Acyl-CoA synthetase (AMP-forming)/AMP-acid ligase II n=1 Tax=Paractinoplanes abujensis TaxID=882441 RepID=A0A7W7CQW8_9ACTN|nr:AMP-binding protein [Actinoplanes abujensis]MBB4693042.1 acyl-CoA synthetase (AMP-forming)/AMP-acid ligase II [Actinoplanes abujensis]GID24942.1 AMP-dependent synthetase and ligase [Actinoplanes abujensis]